MTGITSQQQDHVVHRILRGGELAALLQKLKQQQPKAPQRNLAHKRAPKQTPKYL
jgi:hypothetical protein